MVQKILRSNLVGNAGLHVDFVDSGIGRGPPWLRTESQFLRWDKAISSPNTQKSLAPQIGILSKNPSIHGVFARVKRPNLRSWARVVKSDEEWRRQLTPEQYHVTRKHGTEQAFTGPFQDEKRAGTYSCVCCGASLFASAAKFESGTGWPSTA